MKKFIIAFVLVLTGLVLIGNVASASFFKDVPESAWYYKEVKAANEAGLMLGKSDEIFDPKGLVTRAEIATLLSRIDESDVREAQKAGFPDVKDSDWYAKYIDWAYEKGILKGYDDGTVRPKAPIKRQELAAMIARYVEGRGLTLPASPKIDKFSDSDRIASWAAEASETLRMAGIFGGDSQGRFSPASNATRAEVAALSVRIKDSVTEAENTVLIGVKGKKPDFAIVIPDNEEIKVELSEAFLVLKKPFTIIKDSENPRPNEIIIGDIDRPEAKNILEGLGKYEYRIRVDTNEERTTVTFGYHMTIARKEAVEYFLENYFNGYEIRVPKDLDVTRSYEFTKPYGDAPMIKTDVPQLRDPFVLLEDGVYYMYGTGWRMYKNDSGDLAGHWDGPYNVVENPEDYSRDKWAPEVYKYNGSFYMFTTYTSKRDDARGVAVFRSDSPEGPFRIVSDGPVTPDEWFSIDGTLYIDPDGQPWMVFVHEHVSLEDNVGRMACARLSDDLTHFISEPVEMFRADDPVWAVGGITDGPFMYTCENGELLMIWSNDGKFGYCVGIVRSENGRVDGKWIQDEDLLYSLDLSGTNPGGHGMIFTALDGKMYLSFHSPNVTILPDEKEVPYLLPIREDDGTLVWDLGES